MDLSLVLVSSLQWKKRSSKAMIRGRGKRRIGGDDFVMTEIPLEIQNEILIRLPAKSLMRFKCVSKLWFSLIRSRYLSNRYYLTVASTPRLYMSFVDHGHRGYKLPRESFLISLSSSSFSDSDVSFDQDLILPGMGGDNMVALRGLILYMVRRKACIYNPATRQSITLPVVKSKIFSQEAFRKHVFYFFGHDPVLDQYKVIYNAVICSQFFERITSEHWVLVLEAGGSWKRVEFNGQPHCPARPGLCISGVIYYLASTSMSRSIVVSFDVRSEVFNTFQVLHSLSTLYMNGGFIEYGGKPAIFDHNHLVPMGLVDLWVLEDGGRWSTKSLVLQPCHMHLVDNNTKLFVHGTTQNGEVILAPLGLISPYYILYYDVQKNDLRKVIIRGIPDNWYGKLNKVYTTLNLYMCIMDKSESIMHLEI